MDASSIIEQYGRGIPAILHSAMIVDVCAYLRSSQSPAALVLSDGGDIRGILSQREIIGAAGRIGSSVMQMLAGELLREQAAVCRMDTQVTEILELLSETGAEFVLVCDGTTIKGVITQQDITELLAFVMGASSEPGQAAEVPAQAVQAAAAPVQPSPQMQPETVMPVAPIVHAVPVTPVPAPPSAMTAAYQTTQPAGAPAMPGVAQMQAPQPATVPLMPQVPDVPPASAFAQPQAQVPHGVPAHAASAAVPLQAPQPAPMAAPAAAAGAPSMAGWTTFNS